MPSPNTVIGLSASFSTVASLPIDGATVGNGNECFMRTIARPTRRYFLTRGMCS